jgi:peptidoglycan biosynthesis protein MviN/MurJ (putative lipid II flippase)
MGGSPTNEIQAQPSAVRGSATVSAWTLVSRVTGLARVIVLGAVLGPTFFANIFVATNTLPNVVYLSIAGTVLGGVVVPAIIRTTAANGADSAVDLLARVAGFLVRLTCAVAVLVLFGAPVIAWLLTLGIADAATRWRAEQFTVVMLLFVVPQIAFYIIATLGAAAQQARGRFALAAAAPAVENVGVMATVATAGLVYGRGLEMGEAPLGLAISLCVGSTLSVALHMALQLFGAARVGLQIRPRLARSSDPLTLEVTLRIRRSLLVAASPQVAYFALLALAGTVPGGGLVFQMAYLVYSLPVALGGRAVSTAVLPGLSDAANRTDPKMFNEKAREGITYAFVAGLPSMFVLLAFAFPIADILANGRLRVDDLIQALAGCIVVLAVAQLAAGLHEVLQKSLFALLDVQGPRIAALLGLGATIVAGLGAVHWLAGTDRLVGLGGALLAGDVAAAATAMFLLRRAIRPDALADYRRLRIAGLASTATLPLLAGGRFLITVFAENRIQEFVIVGLASLLALGSFAVILYAYGARHLTVAR